MTSTADYDAIMGVLKTYTNSVNSGNEEAFKALLLDEHIPFAGVSDVLRSNTAASSLSAQQYDQFRRGIFLSGQKFEQEFYNVKIDQDGPLATVSRDFTTKETGTNRGSYGFKVLHLRKVDNAWKIASEFYTGRAIPGAIAQGFWSLSSFMRTDSPEWNLRPWSRLAPTMPRRNAIGAVIASY